VKVKEIDVILRDYENLEDVICCGKCKTMLGIKAIGGYEHGKFCYNCGTKIKPGENTNFYK